MTVRLYESATKNYPSSVVLTADDTEECADLVALEGRARTYTGGESISSVFFMGGENTSKAGKRTLALRIDLALAHKGDVEE
jgi:hypothetical protein